MLAAVDGSSVDVGHIPFVNLGLLDGSGDVGDVDDGSRLGCVFGLNSQVVTYAEHLTVARVASDTIGFSVDAEGLVADFGGVGFAGNSLECLM